MVHALGEAKTGRRGTNDQLSWKWLFCDPAADSHRQCMCIIYTRSIVIQWKSCDCDLCWLPSTIVLLVCIGRNLQNTDTILVRYFKQSLVEQKGVAYKNAVGGGGQCNHGIHINLSATPTAVLKYRNHICGDHAVNVFTDSSFHCYLVLQRIPIFHQRFFLQQFLTWVNMDGEIVVIVVRCSGWGED